MAKCSRFTWEAIPGGGYLLDGPPESVERFLRGFRGSTEGLYTVAKSQYMISISVHQMPFIKVRIQSSYLLLVVCA
jgi:hypothetical protein